MEEIVMVHNFKEFISLLLLLLSCFSHVRLCATPKTAAHQALPSLGFSRQEHWSGLPFPSPMPFPSQNTTYYPIMFVKNTLLSHVGTENTSSNALFTFIMKVSLPHKLSKPLLPWRLSWGWGRGRAIV